MDLQTQEVVGLWLAVGENGGGELAVGESDSELVEVERHILGMMVEVVVIEVDDKELEKVVAGV